MVFKSLGTGVEIYEKAIKDGTKWTEAFSKAAGSVWSAIGAGAKFTIAATAIAGILTAVNAWKEHQEQLIQTAQRNAEAYSDSAEAIANYRKESESLITSINSGTLSSEEMHEARSRLLEIENELVNSYGAERDSLNLLTADIESATDAYDKLSQKKANEFLTNNQSQINKAIEEIYSDKNHRAATVEWSSTPDYIQSRIKDIVESNGGSLEFIQAIGSSLERAEITFNGTASEYKDFINSIASDFRELSGYADANGISLDNLLYTTLGSATTFSGAFEEESASIGEIIDNYGSQAAEGVNAMIAASETYSGMLKGMERAESDYIETASKSYDSAIERSNAMAEVKENVDTAISTFDNATISDKGVSSRLESEVSGLREIQKELALGVDIGAALGGKETEKNIYGIINSLKAFEDEAGEIDVSEILNVGLGHENWATSAAGIENLSKQERAYLALKNALSEYDYTVEDAIPILKQYGLISKTTSELLGDATKAYTNAMTEHDAVQAVLNEQSAAQSVSLETYESLIAISDEYADCLINQNGAMQLNAEKLQELARSRAADRLETVESNRAQAESKYEENSRKIDDLETSIANLKDSTSELKDYQKDLIATQEDEIRKLLEENSSLDTAIDKYKLMAAAIREAMSARAAWVNSQDDPIGDEAFQDAAGALNHLNEVLNNPNSAIYGYTNNSRYKSALDFVVPEDIAEQGEEAVRAYLDGINDYLKTDGSGNVTGIDPTAVWNKISSLFEPDGSVKEGTTLKDFAEQLGTTEEIAESILEVMNVMGAELTWDDGVNSLEELSEKTSEAETAANEVADAYEKLHGIEIPKLEVETEGKDVEGLKGEIEDIKSYIDTIKGMGLDDDTESKLLENAEAHIREIVSMIQDQQGLRIDVSNVEEGYEEIATGINEYQSALADLETAEIMGDQSDIDSAKQKLREIAEDIAQMEKADELGLAFNIENGEELTQLQEKLENWATEGVRIPLRSSENTIVEEIDEITGKLDSLESRAPLVIKINSSQVDEAVSALEEVVGLITAINNLGGYVNAGASRPNNGGDGDGDGNGEGRSETTTVNYELGSQAPPEPQNTTVDYIKGSQEQPSDATATVHYKAIVSGLPTGFGGLMVNGTAHAGGTAKASGDWGTAPSGRTLVGELGREIVVDPHTGRWYTVGDNGAEFVDMPGGAIVFNHIQSRALLENGYVTSRGKALAGGTAMASTVGGNAGDFLDKILSGYFGSNSGGSGSSSSSSSSSGSSEDFADRVARHKHYLNMEEDTFEEYIEWLDREYKKAYEKGQIEKEDQRKYEEGVYEGRKELFRDYLNDIEHYIEKLEREGGNESTIIDIYLAAISDIEKKIEDAKAYGLDENSDYIQELTDQLYGYQDEISDIQEEATDDAKSAIEDLVDYRIDMIKKDVENEKDSLDQKLDDLKDFYNKQKDMLKEVRDEEKYLEEQSEKRKTKAELEAELSRLELDNSAWAQKRKIELEEELAEAEKDLSDFEKDHALEAAQEMLDKMYERQEEQIQSEIDALDERLNDPEALYNQALRDIQANTLALYEEMVEYNKKYGSGNPEDTVELWTEAKDSLDKYLSTYGEAYKGIVLVDPSSGYASGTHSAAPGIHAVDELGPEYYFTSADGTRYRVFSGGEKVLNARATNFLYNFANSGGSVLSKIFDGMAQKVAGLETSIASNRAVEITAGDIIIQGNADQSTVSELRRMKRDEMQWILKEFNKMNRRS